MKLLDRMRTQIRADAHGVMDTLENRGLLMKQHLREAELELDRKRAGLEALDDEVRRLGEGIEREQKEIGRLDQDVELALQGGKPDLARFALRRLIPHRHAADALGERRLELERERARRAALFESQQQAFAQLRERVRVQLLALEAEWLQPAAGFDGVTEEEIDLELLRRAHDAERNAAHDREDA